MAKTLLVADDSATMRRVVEMTFAGEDLQVLTAPSGEAALQKARDVKPDVVLADAQMGSMSGYELCRAIKADAGLRAISVIVMASQHAPYDESLGRDVGADDHCIKPFDTQALIDKVKAASLRGSTVKMPGAPAGMPAAGPVTSPMIAASVLDIAPPSTGSQPIARPSGAPTLKTPAVPPPPSPFAPASVAPPVSAAPPAPVAAPPAAPPARPVTPPLVSFSPSSVPPAPAPSASSPPELTHALISEASDSAVSQALGKAGSLGLTPEQATAIAKLTREVVERVVWEVVPDLAETLIREEIRRLTRA